MFQLDSFHLQKCVTLSGISSGDPMGSCVSPVVANIFMKDFDHYALNSLPFISIYYVDDTFCVLNTDFLLTFLDHLNLITFLF